MDDRKMEIISQLMEELQEEMGYSEDDLGERLGRRAEKPSVEVVSMEMGEEPEMEMAMEEEAEDPLMQRLKKLRGADASPV